MDIKKTRKKIKKPEVQGVKINVVKKHISSEEKERILERQKTASNTVSVKDIKDRKEDVVESVGTFSKKYFIIGFILVILSLVTLFLAGNFLYREFFKTEKKAILSMVPKDAIFYVQINISDNKLEKFYKLLKRIPDYDIISQEISEYIQNELLKSGINFKKDLDIFLARSNINFAVINNVDKSKSKILFLKVSDKNKVKDLIFNNKLNNKKTFSYKDFSIKTAPFNISISEDNLKILSLDFIKNIIGQKISKKDMNRHKLNDVQGFDMKIDEISYTLIDDFIVISDDPRGIKSIINTYKNENESIADSEIISEYINNKESFCSGYVNFGEENIIGFNSEIKDNGINIKTFSKSSSELQTFSAKDDLLKSIPNESLFFYGSSSLSNDFKKIKDSFLNLNSTISSTVKKIENSLAKYNFNLENFISTLDSNGYIFIIDHLKNNKFGYSIVLSLNNSDVAKGKINLMEEVLKKIAVKRQSLEKKIKHSGESAEAVASLSAVQFNEVKLNKTAIKVMQSQLPWEIAYAFYDNKLIVSNSLDSVKNIIMASQGENRITDDFNFKKSKSRIRSDVNNIYFVNTKDIVNYYNLFKLKNKNELAKKNLTSVKNLLGVDYKDVEMNIKEMFLLVE